MAVLTAPFDTDACLARLSGTDLTRAERAHLEDSLVRAHLPMARRLASRFVGSGAGLDDLTQVASLAMVMVVRRFDPNRGQFEKYAHATIRGELKKHLRDRCWTVRPTRRVQELHLQISTATESLAQSSGQMPTVDGVAAELGAERSHVREAMTAATCYRAVSLDQPIGSLGRSLGETLTDVCAGYESVENSMVLGQLFRNLNQQERHLLWLRFVDGRTQREIADLLGMSQMMVSRRLSTLLASLRAQAGSVSQAA